MNDQYLNTVRLMLAIAPDVFDTSHLTMKGGTAINMPVQDLPVTVAAPSGRRQGDNTRSVSRDHNEHRDRPFARRESAVAPRDGCRHPRGDLRGLGACG